MAIHFTDNHMTESLQDAHAIRVDPVQCVDLRVRDIWVGFGSDWRTVGELYTEREYQDTYPGKLIPAKF